MTQKKQICTDCDKKTENYYMIPTNKGNIYKCRNCYEVWITRTTREQSQLNIGSVDGQKIIDAQRPIS